MTYQLDYYIDNSRDVVNKCMRIVGGGDLVKPLVVKKIHLYYYYLAINDLLTGKNRSKVKLNFVKGILALDRMNHYSYYYTKPTQELSSLLLSGCTEQLDYFIGFEFVEGSRCAYSKMILAGPMVATAHLLRGDIEKAKETHSRWIRGSSYKKGHIFYTQLDVFYEGLIKGSKNLLKDGMNKILSKENVSFFCKEYGPWEKEFSTIGNFCAKLSWMLGYEMEFENPQIHMELIKTPPLQKYPNLQELINEFQ